MTLVGDLIGSLPRGTPNIRTGLIAGTRVDRGYRPVFLRIYDGYSELADFAPVEPAPILLPLRGGRFDTIAQAPRLATQRIDAPHGDTEFTLSKLKIWRIGIGSLLLGRARNLFSQIMNRPLATSTFLGRTAALPLSPGGVDLPRHAEGSVERADGSDAVRSQHPPLGHRRDCYEGGLFVEHAEKPPT